MVTQDAVFELPIRIICTQPRWLSPLIIIAITGAVICIVVADLTLTFRALLAVVLALLVVKAPGLTRQPCRGFILNSDDRWLVLKGGNLAVPATLNKATVVLGGAIVLVLKSDNNQYYNFILTGTNVDRAQLRRLRIRLYYPKSGMAA